MKAWLARRSWSMLALLLLVNCSMQGVGQPAPTPTDDLEVENVQAPEGPPLVPPGFRIQVAYSPLELPTALATDGKHLYTTEFRKQDVKRLTDTNGDGVFDAETTFATGFGAPRGLAFEPQSGALYVAALGKIFALRDPNDDGTADDKRLILDNLFYVDGSHANNGIAFGPDGRLYVANGQPRKAALDLSGPTPLFKGAPVPEFAGVIFSASPDGSDKQVFAKGFRNPYDLVFDESGNLYATDNGEDSKGNAAEGDELNLIERGADYGFPFVLGDPPPDSTTHAPLISFPGGASPDGLAVYNGTQFPAEYRGNIFIAQFSDPRRVVRAWQDAATGKWQYEDFVTNLDRPIDVLVGADGALYIADMNSGEKRRQADPDRPGVIYRVDYVGN